MTGLILRPVRTSDEDVVRAAHTAMTAEDFGFALGLRDGMAFGAWVEALADDGAGLDFAPHVWVPSTFLLAEVDGEVVGRTSVRHRLNDWLAVEGGHIGYGVLAAHRRRGYATEMLRQSLVVAREHGVDRVLVTCDDDNVGSAAVIERCGGLRDTELPLTPGPPPKRRYWFT